MVLDGLWRDFKVGGILKEFQVVVPGRIKDPGMMLEFESIW